MKTKLLFILLVAGIMFSGIFSSCCYFYDHTFSITNTTESLITIHYVTNRYPPYDDVTITLNKQETKSVILSMQGGKKSPAFYDLTEVFSVFTITKNDSVSHRDYLKNENWNYVDGNYTTTVTDSEF